LREVATRRDSKLRRTKALRRCNGGVFETSNSDGNVMMKEEEGVIAMDSGSSAQFATAMDSCS